MSQIGKVLLFVGLVFLVLWGISMRVLQGNYMPFVWVLLGVGVISLFAAIFKDIQFFIELAGQRTTKHGMNLGVMVLLVLGILAAVNYINFRHVKKIDMTKEGLHSLSDQTKNILKSLDSDLTVNAFFDDNDQMAAQAHNKFKEVAELFQAQSPHVKIAYFSPVRHLEKAKALEINASAQIALDYKGKKAKFEEPTEQGFTNAIIKITRGKNKIVYFVKGHGEHDIDSQEPTEMGQLKKMLTDMSYDVKPLNFVEKQTVPEDADLVVIAGPKQPYFDAEIKSLKDYLYKGGHLFLALDPGTKENLGSLAHDIGVNYENNYVLDPLAQVVGGGIAMVMGMDYSHSSDITKGFQAVTLFYLASAVEPAKDKPEGINVETIIKSSPKAFTKSEVVEGKVKFDPAKDKMQNYGVVATATGKLREESGKGTPQEFSAVVAGDSDFLTNRLINNQLNPDLAQNIVSYLAKDKDLVSIHPKKSEGSIITMTEIQKSLVGWMLIGILPLLLAVTGGTFWYRRRTV